MQFQLSVALLAICALASGSYMEDPQQRLAQILLQSSAAFEDNPSGSMECFNKYLTLVNEATNKYEKGLNDCGTELENGMNSLEDDFAPDRDIISSLTSQACALYDDCNSKNKAIDFFTCHGSAGTEAAKKSNTIKNQADQSKNNFNQQKAQLDFNKTQCDSACRVEYQITVGSYYEELQICMASVTPAPPPSTITTTENPTESTPEGRFIPSNVMQRAMFQFH